MIGLQQNFEWFVGGTHFIKFITGVGVYVRFRVLRAFYFIFIYLNLLFKVKLSLITILRL